MTRHHHSNYEGVLLVLFVCFLLLQCRVSVAHLN